MTRLSGISERAELAERRRAPGDEYYSHTWTPGRYCASCGRYVWPDEESVMLFDEVDGEPEMLKGMGFYHKEHLPASVPV